MSATDHHDPAPRRRRFRLRRPTWRGWFAIGLVVVVTGLVVAWIVDTATLHGRIARNVTIENVDVGRLSGPALASAVARADDEYGKGTVEFVIDGKIHRLSAGEIGLHLDTAATLRAARRLTDDDPAPLRPVFWLTAWFQPRRVPVTVHLDRAKLAQALAKLPGQTPVTEPRVVGSVDTVGTSPGASGYGFDPRVVARRIEVAARDGALPLRVPLVAETVEPSVSDAEVEKLADQARLLTSRDLVLTVPGRSMTATPPMLRSWITSVVPPGTSHARLAMRADAVRTSARQQLGTVLTTSRPATFTVEGDQVLLVPQVDGTRCCSSTSGSRVLHALESNAPSAALDVVKHPPTFTTAKARALGITTLLGAGLPAQPQRLWSPDATVPPASPPGAGGSNGSTTSTTTSTTTTSVVPDATGAPGAFVVPIPNRTGQAQNVERAIDLLRGRIILPKQRLSLGQIIGAPSPARHFVPADVATADGPTWVSGGGTDLVAAALFEAAYEAGLDIPESTPHDVLPEGVRPGIDATLGWTGPDLVVANPSDHAVLIWADRVASGVRVRLFGTPFTTQVTTADSQTPFGPGGACLAANVKRTREFVGGRQQVDTFSARYTPPPTGRDDPDRVICPG